MSKSVAQLTYYSERACLPVPDEREKFVEQLARPSARFVV